MKLPSDLDLARRQRPRVGGGSATLAARACIVALGLTLAPTATAADPAHDDVVRLVREGRAARDRGDRDLALELLRQAWSIRKTHDGAASLAQVEYELGFIRDAAEHLFYACDHLPAAADPARVERLRAALAQIQQRVVTLRLRIEPKTAEVALNGQALGVAVELPRAIFANPGALSLSATLDAHASWSTTLHASAGDERVVRVKLEPLEPPAERSDAPSAAPLPRERSSAASAPSHPSWTPVIVSGAVTGAALAGGIAFWLSADAKERDAQRRLDGLSGKNRCGSGTPFTSTCGRVRDRMETAGTFRGLAYGSFAAAAVGAAISYVMWPRSGENAITVGAAFDASTVWTGARGTF